MHKPVLIFDFGNVVGFFDYLRACDRLAGPLGITGTALRDRLLDRGFDDWLVAFESGRIGPEAFASRVMEAAGVRLEHDQFVRAWEDIFWPNEPVGELIAALKASDYRVFLGSNTNILHATFYRRQFAPTLDLLDGLILSYEVGQMKPARAFFDACVAAAGVPPASCLFIDDIEENVEGARQAGLVGIHYQETPLLLNELRRLGIETTTPIV